MLVEEQPILIGFCPDCGEAIYKGIYHDCPYDYMEGPND